jgi:hypothetical protein
MYKLLCVASECEHANIHANKCECLRMLWITQLYSLSYISYQLLYSSMYVCYIVTTIYAITYVYTYVLLYSYCSIYVYVMTHFRNKHPFCLGTECAMTHNNHIFRPQSTRIVFIKNIFLRANTEFIKESHHKIRMVTEKQERASLGITSATKLLLDTYRLGLVNGDENLATGLSYDKVILRLLQDNKKDA